MHPNAIEYSKREVIDAAGVRQPTGPNEKDTAEAVRLLSNWGRDVGRLAVMSGMQLEVLLGMLDAGVDVHRIVTALVMHGEVTVEETDETRDRELHLAEHEGRWQVQERRAS